MSIPSKIKSNLKNGTLISAAFKAVKNRFIKWIKYHNAHYFFDEFRVKTKKIEEQFETINKNHELIGDYYLDKRITTNKNSIIYSIGILCDIKFDKAITKKYGCHVYMYDPTPVSIEFMKTESKKNSLFNFFPYGVWIENTKLKFYTPTIGGSSSVVEKSDAEIAFTAECKKLDALMKINNHSKIDVLKMDIEGASLFIVEYLIENKMYPNQIITEFERPKNKNSKDNEDYFTRIIFVTEQLKKNGYEINVIPQSISKYYALQFIFSKKSAFN